MFISYISADAVVSYPSFIDTWDSAETGNMSLTNGSLTVTNDASSNYESTRTVNSRDAGKVVS